jgi:outer membrane lipoprotein SlyB
MKNRLLSLILFLGLILGTGGPASAMAPQVTHHHYVHRTVKRSTIRHKRHMRTAKRIGIGAAGGAAIGALAGGGKGAGIGAAAGAAAGALYDAHKRHEGK